ncbi:MAG: MFS transporter [Spirochaetes bacterium]|nr:MFS transporter [Spirochaetota bacterium]
MKGEDSVFSIRSAKVTFLLLFLLYMFDYIDRLIIVSLFPFLKRDWGISDAQCGLLVSAVYWSILLFSIPVSILIDRWSRKKSIGLMSVLWSIATFSCAFASGFKQLFVARTAIGIGEAGYAPGGTAMISALFPEEKRARMLGIWNASIPLGSALGIALGGIIAEHFGWRHAFGVVALPGLLIALLMFRVRDYKTVELVNPQSGGDRTAPSAMSRWDIARQFISNKSLVFNNLAFACNVFVTTALLSWLPTFFHRTDGIPVSEAGIKGGAVMLLAVVGAPLGGFVTDRWLKRNQRARMLLPALSSVVSAVILYVCFSHLSGTPRYLSLLLAGISVMMFVPAGVAVTQDVVHPGLRALSLSVNVVIQHSLGSPLGPLFVGAVSDRMGIEAAMSVLPVFTVVAGVLFFIGSFYYVGDLQRVVKVQVELE